MAQPISISEHFGYRKLLRFTIPSMVMMVFTSVYSIVDGLFVSNFVGKTAFAAVNLIFPFLMVLGVVGYMLGTGGSALVAKMLGEGQKERAQRVFSLLVVAGVVVGIVFASVGMAFLPQVAVFLGADEAMKGLCVEYGQILMLTLPFFILQYMFQSLMVTAERPKLGLWMTVAAGVMNIVLDFVLIVVLGMGLRGAAIASAMSEVMGGLVPVVYFLFPNGSLLRLVRPVMDWRALGKACSNGLSEFFGSVSGSVVAMCYNYQLMRYIGEDGVSAYGVIMYVQFVFFAVFLGYTIGSSPIVSYCHGAKNHAELHNVFVRSLRIMGVLGVGITAAMELLAWPLTKLFVGYDPALFALTRRAFMIYGASYVLVGFNFYASAFFTALNNGVVCIMSATGWGLRTTRIMCALWKRRVWTGWTRWATGSTGWRPRGWCRPW